LISKWGTEELDGIELTQEIILSNIDLLETNLFDLLIQEVEKDLSNQQDRRKERLAFSSNNMPSILSDIDTKYLFQ
jgi:hypothetical protein